MRKQYRPRLALVPALLSLLLVRATPLALAQNHSATAPPLRLQSILPVNPKSSNPAVPLQDAPIRLLDGKFVSPRRQQVTSRGFKNVPRPPRIDGKVMGDTGVVQASPIVLPIDSKGSLKGLAFRNSLFMPPVGERLQPALSALAQSRMSTATGAQPAVYAIVQFKGRAGDAERTDLSRLGVDVLGYYPHHAFLARIPAQNLNAVSQLPTVNWVGQPTASQKFHPALAQTLLAPQVSDKSQLSVFVSFFTDDKTGEMRKSLTAAGATLGYYAKSIAVQTVQANPTTLAQIAGLDCVLFIEPVGQVHTLNIFGSTAVAADYLWGVYAPTSNGTQVKIGELDTGVYAYHEDFTNLLSPGGGFLGYSLVSGESWYNDLDGHGTFVAGTILGEGLAYYGFRGIAADLYSHGDSANPDFLVAQVLDQNGNGSDSTVVTGMELLDTGSGIAGYQRQVWNASLGGGGFPSDAPSRKWTNRLGMGYCP